MGAAELTSRLDAVKELAGRVGLTPEVAAEVAVLSVAYRAMPEADRPAVEFVIVTRRPFNAPGVTY